MKTSKIFDELSKKVHITHHSSFACVCKFPSGRTLVVRTSMSYHDALIYARWFVDNNLCDCLIVRPYDIKIDGVKPVYTLYDNVIKVIEDNPF